MADHIPFVNTSKDCEVLKKFYPDSFAVRVSLERLERIMNDLPMGLSLWVDPAVDGLHRWPDVSNDYRAHIGRFPSYDRIGDPVFQAKPVKDNVQSFVDAVLDECCRTVAQVQWLSIPQLPVVNDTSRNRINRLLAESTSVWKANRRSRVKLILPIVLTHQNQINLKTQRNKPIRIGSRPLEQGVPYTHLVPKQ